MAFAGGGVCSGWVGHSLQEREASSKQDDAKDLAYHVTQYTRALC